MLEWKCIYPYTYSSLTPDEGRRTHESKHRKCNNKENNPNTLNNENYLASSQFRQIMCKYWHWIAYKGWYAIKLTDYYLWKYLVSVWLHGISTIIGYLMPNPFYTYKQFYFKLFNLTLVHSLNVKIELF